MPRPIGTCAVSPWTYRICLERHAEPFMHELREHGRVALAVRMGAAEDRERAARIEAHIHAVVEDAAELDVVADCAAAQLASLLDFLRRAS